MAVFAEAIAKRDPRAMRLYFDVSGIVGLEIPETANLMALRIRQVGVARILYGTDGSADRLASRKGWTALRQLPLSDEEFGVIADNVVTYMR